MCETEQNKNIGVGFIKMDVAKSHRRAIKDL
jgi:hypothetical protein